MSTQYLKLTKAELLMHKPDVFLMLMHSRFGAEFFIVPGGKVSSEDAAKIIARPDVVARDNALFPGLAGQSWQLRRDLGAL